MERTRVHIQVQDLDGMWRTLHTTENNSQKILAEMRTIKERQPDKRVRAVDASGRLVDMM
jgi:hypothetical protein